MLGVSAVFKPQSGSQVSTAVVLDTDVEAGGVNVRNAQDIRALSALRSDIGVPAAGDVFEIDGTDYTVDGLPEDGAGDAYLIRVIVR